MEEILKILLGAIALILGLKLNKVKESQRNRNISIMLMVLGGWLIVFNLMDILS